MFVVVTSEMVLRRKEENKVKNVRLMSQNEGVQKGRVALISLL